MLTISQQVIVVNLHKLRSLTGAGETRWDYISIMPDTMMLIGGK
jgi:hypothetical protein